MSGPLTLVKKNIKSVLFTFSTFFALQNIQHVDPTSSAVPTGAVSSKVRGSVMETLTATTTQTKHPKTHAALALVKTNLTTYKKKTKNVVSNY